MVPEPSNTAPSSPASAPASPVSAPASVLAAAAALRASLAGFDPALVEGSDCARISEELAVTEKACQSVRLLTAARAVGSGAHLAGGFRDGASWLARQSGTTGQQARRDLQTARMLEDCPQTRDALLAGEISMAQAAEIAHAESEHPGVERTLLPVARDGDLSRLRDRARDERQSRTPVADLHARQRRARSFRHWRDQLGMVCFAGQLPPEVGVPLVTRVEREVQRARQAARAASSGTPPERWEALAADALAGLVAGADRPATGSRRNELVIVCDLFAWRRGHTHAGEVCHVIGGGPIPVDLARELSGDAFVKAVLHDGTAIHTVRHFGRHLKAELRTALDLGPVPCFSGRQCAECGRRWGLEYDHVDPVGHQGPTSYDNLQALCWPDHQAKTERDRQAGLIRGRPAAGRTPRVRPPGAVPRPPAVPQPRTPP